VILVPEKSSTQSSVVPKVFISYSWTTPGHQDQIREWAERLVSDGVEVILDLWDLREGHDTIAFMEKMVTDQGVNHVLIFSDAKYKDKSDSKISGVGTESQIISNEVYKKVEQEKFIPIVCEFDESGAPCLPVYLASRKWLNFSNPEAVNENWEVLVRCIFGKPLYERPLIGTAPLYITDESGIPANPTIAAFANLRQALLNNKTGVSHYREIYLESLIEYADKLRVREEPKAVFGARVVEDYRDLILVRNGIIDWIMLESNITGKDQLVESLLWLLEELLELKARPREMTRWSETWFDAQGLFVCETFLYIVAALIKNQKFDLLNEILTSSYLLPESVATGDNKFDSIGAFYHHTSAINAALSSDGKTFYSQAAELFKRHADRQDLTFTDIMEADLLILFVAITSDDISWYPQTLYYANSGRQFPLFLRAAQGRHFKKLAEVTGIQDAESIRTKAREGLERLNQRSWRNFSMSRPPWWYLNLDSLDTVK